MKVERGIEIEIRQYERSMQRVSSMWAGELQIKTKEVRERFRVEILNR